MPLWNLYCPEATYSAEDKQAFAERITDLYAEFGLPRFYVSVVFQETPKQSYFIGGEPADDFVRIWIHEIARRVPEEARGWWMKRIRETVAPYVTDPGTMTADPKSLTLVIKGPPNRVAVVKRLAKAIDDREP